MSFLARLAVLIVVVAGLARPAMAAVDIEPHVSPAGHTYWLVQEHSIPIVAVEMGFANGAWADPEGKEGLARFMVSMMDEGAGDLDAVAFEKRADDIAAGIGFGSSRDGASASARFLVETLDEGVDLFALALSRPRFDAEPVERIRRQILSGIAQAETQPSSIAARAWFARAFPGHPYGRTTRGTVESVGAITVEDMRAAHQRIMIRRGTVVSLVGAVGPGRAGEIVDRLLAGLAEGETPTIPSTNQLPPAGVHVIAEDVPQSVALFGQRGLPRTDPDFIPAFVMNHILGGGGFSSWLTTEVRERRGLAYSVSSSLRAFEASALIIGSVQTENARISESLDVIRDQWKLMAEGQLTQAQLDAARTYLTGSFPLGFDSNAKIANYLVFAQEENLGIDYINRRNELIDAVTLEDIKRVAAGLLDADALSVVVVGQPEGL